MTALSLSPTADPALRSAAFRLSDRLAASVVDDQNGAPQWFGDEVDPAAPKGVTSLRHGPVDDGLLTGRAGIALALATSATAADGDPDLARLAWETIDDVIRRRPQPVAGAAGWQSGDLGIAFAADRIAEVLDDGPLALEAASLATRAVTVLARGSEEWIPSYPDLLDGLAGHLLAVLSARLPASAEHVRIAAAARLVAAIHAGAIRDEHGARWKMAGTELSVAGMAHGASGIMLALAAARAAGIPGSDRGIIEDAQLWESGCYDSAANGWWDLRLEEPVIGMAWCHGAPGIGIGAAARAQLGEQDLVGTYLRAVRSARGDFDRADVDTDADADATLCHGRAGIIELHLAGAQAWPSATEHLRSARALAQDIVAGVGADGATTWSHGVVGGSSPAILDGVAGVVVTLLRCDAHESIPALTYPGLPRR